MELLSYLCFNECLQATFGLESIRNVCKQLWTCTLVFPQPKKHHYRT